MLYLNTTQSLEVLLGGAVTATQLQITGSYADLTVATMALAAVETISSQTNSTTAVTAVDVAGSGTRRKVVNLAVFNADDATQTVIVRLNDNSTLRKIVSLTLAAGDTLTYVDGTGWGVIDNTGQLKCAGISPNSIANSHLAQVATDTIKGRTTAGTGNEEDLTAEQVKALLEIEADDVGGLGTLATQDGTFSGTSSGTNTGDQTNVSGNAGTATALATARTIDGQSFDGTANITVIAPGTNAATSKTTPVDADQIPLVDSEASNVLKKLTWANLKATLKTYFDTLYNLYVHPNHTGEVTSAADGATTIATAAVTLAKMADIATARLIGRTTAGTGVPEALDADAVYAFLKAKVPVVLTIAVGDETTAITTGTAKVTFRMPFAMTLTGVRASLTTVSSSGIPTFDINEGGSTILSTKLTVDASEKTSTTAATPAVISDTSLADDAEMTIDVDVAGTGAAGPKVTLIGYQT